MLRLRNIINTEEKQKGKELLKDGWCELSILEDKYRRKTERKGTFKERMVCELNTLEDKYRRKTERKGTIKGRMV